MALFENFPYTNFHEMNLDWLLQKVKALAGKVDELEIIADTFDADIVIFKETSGSYSKLSGKNSKQLYDDIQDGKKVIGILEHDSGSFEYAYEIAFAKLMAVYDIYFKFSPVFSSLTLDPTHLYLASNRQIDLHTAMPNDTISYSEDTCELTMV